MANVEIIQQQEIDKIIALDKAISNLDDQLQALLKTAININTAFEKTASSQKDVSDKTKEYAKATEQTNQNQKALSNLEKERIKIKEQQRQVLAKVIASQSKSAETLAKGKVALQENNKELRENAKQQKLINQRLKEGQKDAATITGQYAKLSAQLNKQRALAKDLAIAYGENSKQYKAVAKDVNNLDKQLKKVDSGLGQNQRSVGNYGNALGGLSPRFQGVISMAQQAGTALKTLFANPVGLVIAAVAGLGAIIGKSIKQATEYQAANAELASVMGITRAQTAELQKESQRLGATTAFTASEVTQLQIEYARLGLSQDQIKDVTKTTIDLSIAAKASAADTAAFVGSAINQFKLTSDQAVRIADVAAKSYSTTALSFEKLNEGYAKAAPAAAAFGDSIEQTTAKLGVLANAGISAEKAGTGLKAMYLELAKTGMTWDDAMAQINSSTNKLDAANQLFGKNFAVNALTLAENADQVKELTAAYEEAGGTVEGVAKEQLNTVEGSIKLLGSAWSGFLFAFEDGEGVFMKIWKGIIDGLTWFLSTWTNIIKGISKGFKQLTDLFKSEERKQLEAAEAAAKEKEEIEKARLEEAKKRMAQEAQAEAEKQALILEAQKEADAEAKKMAAKRHEEALSASEAAMNLRKMQMEAEKQAVENFNDFMSDDEKEMIAEIEAEEKAAFDQSVKFAEIEYQRKLMLLRANSEDDKEFAMKKMELDNQMLQNSINNIQFLLENNELSAERRIELEVELAEQQLELDKMIADSNKNTAEENIKNIEAQKEKQKEIQEELVGLANKFFDFRSQKIASDLAEVERANEAGLLSDKEYQRQKAELELKAAKNERIKALFGVAIKTAEAVTGAVAASPQTFGLPFSAFALATGAIQAASILAQPLPEIPQFLEGTHGKFNTPDTYTTSEDGRTELITLKTGKMFTTDQPTLFSGNQFKGARITSNPEYEYIKTHTQHNGFNANSFSDAKIISKLDSVEKAIKNMPVPIYNKNGTNIGYSRNGNKTVNLAKLRQ